MTRESILGYAAGTIDSDGSIQLMSRKRDGAGKYSLRVSVCQVTENVPLWFVRNFGGRVSKFIMSKERRQPVYRWELESNKASSFLQEVLPYLVEKVERAKLGIDYQSTVLKKEVGYRLEPETIQKRIDIWNQMRQLNSKHSRSYWTSINLGVNERVGE